MLQHPASSVVAACGKARVYRRAVFACSPLSGAGAARAGSVLPARGAAPRSTCSSEHCPALLLISPVCFSAFALLLVDFPPC